MDCTFPNSVNNKHDDLKVLFYPTLPNFQKSFAFWKAPRLRPFFLLVTKTLDEESVEHWWNGADRGKPKYTERGLSRRHLVHQKFQLDSPDIETAVRGRRLTDRVTHGTAFVNTIGSVLEDSVRTAQ
jgi:hypothetical protein